jgi:O-antigen/teichoic acid export membrane protein
MPTNTARIAKNTLMLYFRQILIMLVSLYTVRVVLNTLGVEDYGIYNVAAGLTSMFSFLSGSMSGATQRFFSFELGKGKDGKYNNIFCTCVNIYVFIAVISAGFLETLGLWFFNAKLVIPYDRVDAARFLYHFVVFSFVMQILTTAYTASVISHERMTVFAGMSIVDVVLKLVIVFFLRVSSMDKLKLYALLMFFVSCFHFLLYMFLCRKLFPGCRYRLFFDAQLFKEMIAYTGWNTIGVLSDVVKNQGINIILNIFFGPLVNAARGIAFQVSSVIKALSDNSYTSIRPRITKLYASNNKEEMFSLFFIGTRIIYFLMIIFTIPVILEAPFILGAWLKNVPDRTVLFVRLILIDMLIDCFRYPIQTIVYATGNVRSYHLIVSLTTLLLLPSSYVFLKQDFPPQTPMILGIFFSGMALFTRLYSTRKLMEFPLKKYCAEIAKLFILSLLMILPPGILKYALTEGTVQFFSVCGASFVSCVAVIYFFGLTKYERDRTHDIIKKYVLKKVLNHG